MAAAEYSLQDLCEEATCSICLDFFTEPVTIDCGHNFCQACLKNYWVATEASCPQCREKVQYTQLRPNRQLANVVAIAKKLRNEGEKRAKRNEGACEKHQEPLKLFCKEDQTLICVVCDRSKEHRNHEAVPAEEAAQEYRDQICSYLEILKKEREHILASKAEAEKESQGLLKETKTEKENIMAEFRKLHQFLEAQEKLLLAQTEELEKEIAKKRNEHLARISKELSSVESLIQEVERKCQQPTSELLQDVKRTLEKLASKQSYWCREENLKANGSVL
ncbi:zinc finger protein RFP-like isoform X2 [Sceloporus undulatus]|uniref:zinc finger protein RFP-like isoform X2 n=1 Tax=Sceloporus undulatus TaxID=8520 RepID=UPI001C4C9B60|nr:zinc finger protein RFP-like isoform X2 [Sceloporus undulatus]